MSLLKAIKAQLGLSNTPANNFTITAEADNGTLKLARGNAGATTQDILTVGANGVVKVPQNLVAFSAKQTAAQAFAANTWTKVTGLTTEEFDTTNFFDGVKFQPTVAGYYMFTGAIAFSAGGSSIAFYKNNGADIKYGLVTPNQTASMSVIFFLNGSTDYVEMWGFATSANNTNNGAVFFQGHLLGAA